jgi:hypothetical protein
VGAKLSYRHFFIHQQKRAVISTIVIYKQAAILQLPRSFVRHLCSNFPVRLDVQDTRKILGFSEYDADEYERFKSQNRNEHQLSTECDVKSRNVNVLIARRRKRDASHEAGVSEVCARHEPWTRTTERRPVFHY